LEELIERLRTLARQLIAIEATGGFDEHLLAERAHQLFGVDRPNAPDHPGRKIFLDALADVGGEVRS
jgi:hypothetical protein